MTDAHHADKDALKRVLADPTVKAMKTAAIAKTRRLEFGASLIAAMGATDKEVAEIEALASERSVLHWAGILRIIQRMRNAEASADEGWKRAEENAQEAEKLRAARNPTGSPSKMNETAHTPTPWEAQSIDETGRERGAVSIIGSNLGGLVAAALPWPTELDDGDFRRVQANAEFIVRAVNAHDDMLAALKAVVDQADDLARSFGVDRMHETDDSVLAVCRAAISKATAPTA